MKIGTERIFSAAHILPEKFGKCHRLHGHNWKVIVEIEVEDMGKDDVVVDFNVIKNLIDELDHKTLISMYQIDRIEYEQGGTLFPSDLDDLFYPKDVNKKSMSFLQLKDKGKVYDVDGRVFLTSDIVITKMEPTCENLSLLLTSSIIDLLGIHMPVKIIVRVYETEKSYAENKENGLWYKG